MMAREGVSVGSMSRSGPSVASNTLLYNPRRTILSPSEVKNELDKLFDTLEEGDKTTLRDPTKVMYCSGIVT